MVGLIGKKRSRQQREQLLISSARAAINIPNKSEAGEGGRAQEGWERGPRREKRMKGMRDGVKKSNSGEKKGL